MAFVCKDMRSMPYSQVSGKVMTSIVDTINGEHHRTIKSSNNDVLPDINPDVQLQNLLFRINVNSTTLMNLIIHSSIYKIIYL